jgi:hypothetical protein
MGVTNGRHPHQDRHFVAVFVFELHPALNWLAVVQSLAERTFRCTHFAGAALALPQNVLMIRTANYIVAGVSNDVLGAVIPEEDHPIAVGDHDPASEAIEYLTQKFRILQFDHCG